jgi:hypothetical protein
MTAEERLTRHPSTAQTLITISGVLAENFWRRFCSEESAESVWRGVWEYEALEEAIDKLPIVTITRGDDRDMLWFEHYGRGYDMLRFGTWTVLRDEPLAIRRLSGEAKAFAALSHDDVLKGIPSPKPRPATWPTVEIPPDVEELLRGLVLKRIQ